jgi:hypothetical protein
MTVNLKCVNCGAVFRDLWDSDKCPHCPSCFMSWYEDTNEQLHLPTRRKFRIGGPDIVPTLDDKWLPYYVLQNLTQNLKVIDQKLAHDVGLRLAGRPLETIAWQRVLRGLAVSTYRKRKKESYDVHGLLYTEDPLDVELEVLLKDAIAALEKKWATFADKRKFTPSLVQASQWVWPGVNSTKEERRLYNTIKAMLADFRKSIKENTSESE